MSKILLNKLYLKQNLYELKMSESGNFIVHVNNFNKIIGRHYDFYQLNSVI